MILALTWVLFLVVVYGFLYYVTQRAVRKDFEPRPDELLLLLRSSLKDEMPAEG